MLSLDDDEMTWCEEKEERKQCLEFIAVGVKGNRLGKRTRRIKVFGH